MRPWPGRRPLHPPKDNSHKTPKAPAPPPPKVRKSSTFGTVVSLGYDMEPEEFDEAVRALKERFREWMAEREGPGEKDE